MATIQDLEAQLGDGKKLWQEKLAYQEEKKHQDNIQYLKQLKRIELERDSRYRELLQNVLFYIEQLQSNKEITAVIFPPFNNNGEENLEYVKSGIATPFNMLRQAMKDRNYAIGYRFNRDNKDNLCNHKPEHILALNLFNAKAKDVMYICCIGNAE